MPTIRNIIKNAVTTADPNDISAVYSSRYEKIEEAFGVVPSSAFAAGDTLVFPLPMRQLVSARFISQSATPVTLTVAPGTNLTSALRFPVGAAVANIAFNVTYVRGTGAPGTDTTQGRQISITPVLGTS